MKITKETRGTACSAERPKMIGVTGELIRHREQRKMMALKMTEETRGTTCPAEDWTENERTTNN